jgi:hypothetical protein
MKTIWFIALLAVAGFSANAQKPTVEVGRIAVPPAIDGIEEDLWNEAMPNYIDKNVGMEYATVTAYWKALWNENAIFILVNVEDENHWPSWESGGNSWEYDKIELYFDVNDILMDGKGPAYAGAGHYQSAPGFEEGKYGMLNVETGTTYSPACQYAYVLTGESYIYEQSFPVGTFTNKDGHTLTINDLIGLPEGIGFDVTVVDQDEGVTTFRQRKVWQSGDGNEPEAWNTMDDCGAIVLKESSPAYSSDTVLCDSTEAAIITFSLSTDSVATYEWYTDEGTIQYDDTVACRIKWNNSGVKNVKLTVHTESGNTYILEQNVYIYPKLSVSLGDDFLVCNSSNFKIKPEIINGNRPFSYSWNYLPGDSVYDGRFSFNNPVRVYIKDASGCSATDEVFVSVTSMPGTPEICMVTVDAATNKNKIIWQKNYDTKIRSYQVLKETTVAGQYAQIGTVSVSSENIFIDTTSQPSRYSDRYALITTDTCNSQSTLSDPHQPIHLQISQGLPGTYNLSWSPYIGFGYSTYYIYKGKSVNQMELIDELASSKTQYTDTSSGLSYYRVTVRKDDPCMISDKKASDSQYDETGSNVVNTLATEILPIENQMPFQVYPNPFNDELIVEMEIANPHRISIEVYNALGVKIYEYKQEVVAAGNFRHIIHERDIPDISEMNILRLEAGDQTYFLKIIKNK